MVEFTIGLSSVVGLEFSAELGTDWKENAVAADMSSSADTYEGISVVPLIEQEIKEVSLDSDLVCEFSSAVAMEHSSVEMQLFWFDM